MADGHIVDANRRKYIVGFTVHEVRELSLDGNAIDPLCVVRCFGKEYKTQMKRDKLAHAKFEESHIWSDVWLNDAEFAMSFIEFELQAACIFVRNEVIGTGKIQLSMVRKRPNHSYNNKTLQLSNTSRLTARMKVSVFCYGAGDAPPRPEGEEAVAGDDEQALKDLGAAVIGAANVDAFQQAYHLFVHVHRAEHLGGGDKNYDMYVACEFNGSELELPPVTNTNTATFDECFRVPVVTPLFADSIVVRVWERTGNYTAPNVIVKGHLSFSSLRMHAMQPKWFNFYGFDKKEISDVSAITSSGEGAAPNFYMGRLLISGRVHRVSSVSELSKAAVIKGHILEEPPAMTMNFAVDVLEASNCVGTECFVTISIGRKSKTTKPAMRSSSSDPDFGKGGRFTFEGDEGRVDTLSTIVATDEQNQVDMIISVWSNGVRRSALGGPGTEFDRVGFKRMKIKDIRTRKPGDNAGMPQWISLQPMAHLPTSIEPGSLLVSLFKSTEAIQGRSMATIKPLNFELRAYCYMARNLNAMRENHLPNPQVQVSCADGKAETSSLKGTSNPAWCQCLQLPIRIQCTMSNVRVHPEPVQVIVYDDAYADGVAASDAGMGKSKSSKPSNSGSVAGSAKTGSKSGKSSSKSKRKKKAEDENSDDGKEFTPPGTGPGAFEQALAFGGAVAQSAVSKVGAQALDVIGDFSGDVMAKKRLGEMIGGKRVIGRLQVNLRKIVRPGSMNGKSMTPKWLKLKGGKMGSHHVGDILIGFELLRQKYVGDIPVKSMVPVAKPCTLSVAILGLRSLAVDRDLGKPKLMVVGPNYDGDSGQELLQWSKRPKGAKSGGDDDVNRRWTSEDGKHGYEFLSVVHIPVQLPKSAVYEPTLSFRLFAEDQDETDDPVAEGRLTIADRLPWSSAERGLDLIKAREEHVDTDGELGDEGLQVSDAEDGAETLEHYVNVEIVKGPLSVVFNSKDDSSFPPVVYSVSKGSAAGLAGIVPGDWLVGYKFPDDANYKLAGLWSPSKAMEFVGNMDAQGTFPMTLRFRKKDNREVSAWLMKPSDSFGLGLVKDSSISPPKINADLTKDKRWRKLGIKPGWFIVDVNGVDVEDMAGSDPKFSKLISMRPVVFTCRAYGKSGENAAAAMDKLLQEKDIQANAHVMLTGLPSELVRVIKHKSGHKEGCLLHSRTPRPSPVLPPVDEQRFLNMRVARGSVMDVRGVIKHSGLVEEDEDDDAGNSRPTVVGKLEDQGMQPAFVSVELTKGGNKCGLVKIAFKVVTPANPDWVQDVEDADDPDVKLFDERVLRKTYKHEQPTSLRVRTYIIRGLNVSASVVGPGNPFLYFKYGSGQVNLEGNRQMATMEPRFFRTEERDVNFPEESMYEVGLFHWANNNDHQLIGKTPMDLEDRWFSQVFQNYMKGNKVPIEYRPVMNPDGNICKGSLEMWTELLDTSHAAEIPPNQLLQPPPYEVEIRVVVWGVKSVSRKLCLDKLGEVRDKIDALLRVQIECRSCLCPQPKEQETDVHFGCEDTAEYNWRFIFSRVQVTKGVSLDCFLQISLWEHFAMHRPTLLCESMLDMKSYIKKVVYTKSMYQLKADLPLTSQALKELLEKGGGKDDDEDAKSSSSEEEDSSDAGKTKTQKPEKGEEEDKNANAGAIVELMVQVIPQTEASMPDMKAGLGRNEPNQNPAMTFPKTGRNWQSTLPATAALAENIIEAVSSGKSRSKIIVILLLVIGLPLFFGFYVKRPAPDGCPYIQKNCVRACEACGHCKLRNDVEQVCTLFTSVANCDRMASCNLKAGQQACAASCVTNSDGSNTCDAFCLTAKPGVR